MVRWDGTALHRSLHRFEKLHLRCPSIPKFLMSLRALQASIPSGAPSSEFATVTRAPRSSYEQPSEKWKVVCLARVQRRDSTLPPRASHTQVERDEVTASTPISYNVVML